MTESTTPPGTVPTPLRHVHMIGIGGAGMSAVARILLDHGVAVSGSDARDSAELRSLSERGAVARVGHDAALLSALGAAPDIVVVSKAAIPEDNPEMVAARAAGIPVLTRSKVLGHLAGAGRSIMVCGTHGKTSTTSMLIAGMLAAGADPSFAVGGTVLQFGTNARGGADPVFIAEADESDGSLAHYRPDVVILTNAEPDHLDHFGTAEAYFEVFDTFLARIPASGALVVCLDDPGAAERARRAAGAGVRVVGYRTSAGPATDLPVVGELGQVSVDATGARATLMLDGREHGGCTWPPPVSTWRSTRWPRCWPRVRSPPTCRCRRRRSSGACPDSVVWAAGSKPRARSRPAGGRSGCSTTTRTTPRR